ncbi:MAG: DNA topoisomerase VI subunit B [Candidatus Thorarchaeota archaeon]|nr:MAG: DNA topoisomerase VI subunit B [Candidatus Thorarchaeota archaeon]
MTETSQRASCPCLLRSMLNEQHGLFEVSPLSPEKKDSKKSTVEKSAKSKKSAPKKSAESKSRKQAVPKKTVEKKAKKESVSEKRIKRRDKKKDTPKGSEPAVEAPLEESGDIKQGTIAKFMRKRTQLVGFETGLNKHTQYSIEFIDNAIDALESWWWKTDRKPRLSDQLDPKLVEEVREKFKDQLEDTIALSKKIEKDIRDGKQVDIPPRPKDNLETHLARFRKFLVPFRGFITKHEPLVVIQVTELLMPDLVPVVSEEGFKVYEFICFDTGVGMVPADLEKFGIYLASSKSEKLKQTRGSQGFGAPSAFSDAQNTTGKPIFAVTKKFTSEKATVAEYYTTTANTKEYVNGPLEMDLPFDHGTYIRLYYLNIQYKRGYADVYAQMTSLLDPHITLVFIDPYGEVHIYPRRVNTFPEEPKYAQAHPASIRIGEFQDLLRETSERDLHGFLTRGFCRLSGNKASTIIDNTNKELRIRKLPTIGPRTPTDSLSKTEVEYLYKAFSSEEYIAPPTDTVVPVGEEIFEKTIKQAYNPEFVTAITRKPTSGKGLSFAVEVCIAYGGDIKPAGSANAVLWRFVNRVPKLRDNSDCATWKATTSVNWRNYKLDSFDNGVPRGPVMLFIHVCGAYVHVMFKGQSKQALAEDEVLIREIKLALEDAGRKFRLFITRRETAKKKAKRAGILAMYADQFAHSLVAIANDSKRKKLFDAETIASRLRDAISGFEMEADEEEIEGDVLSADLLADIPLGDSEEDDVGTSSGGDD